MSAEAAQGVVMGGYARGLFCECGARRSDKAGARRATRAASRPRPRPGGKSPDGVLARVRGDAAVVREIISLKGAAASSATGSQEHLARLLDHLVGEQQNR
jgi:hypothetical protein